MCHLPLGLLIVANTDAPVSNMSPTEANPGTATLSVPTWLTPQLLTQALREEDDACGQVTTIRVRPATAANENYLSELFRVQAHVGKVGSCAVDAERAFMFSLTYLQLKRNGPETHKILRRNLARAIGNYEADRIQV